MSHVENPALLLRPPSWTRSAACAGMVTRTEDWWHPAEELPSSAKSVAYAIGRLVCAGCPVRHPCALDALQGAIAHGMYGGLTPAERRKIAGRHGYPLPGAPQHGTYSRYAAYGCRCRNCTEAKRRYMAARRAGELEPRRRTERQGVTQSPEARVLRAVKRAGGPVTARAVYRATGVKASRVRQIVAEAVATGKLPAGLLV